MVKEDWVCELCGGTEMEIRNFYKNQAKGTIGFAAEEYCKGCGTALSSIHLIKKTMDHLKDIQKRIKNIKRVKYTCPNCGEIYSNNDDSGIPRQPEHVEYEFITHLKFQHDWSHEDAQRYIEWVKNNSSSG